MTFQPVKNQTYFPASTHCIYTLLCVLAVSLILFPEISRAATIQSFEIDLKELKAQTTSKQPGKKASIQSISKTNMSSKSGKIKKNKTRKTRKKLVLNHFQPPVFSSHPIEDQHKLSLLKALPSPDSVPVQTSDSTLVLKNSASSCDILQQLLKSGFFRPLQATEALPNLSQIASFSIQGPKNKAAVTCNLSIKEELTYGKLFSIHDTKVINITKNDSSEAVVNKLTTNLGYTTQSFRTSLNNKRVYYVFPEHNEKGFFISIP